MQHRGWADRYAYYARRKAQAILHGLRPSGLVGRVRGPRVLVNSIPKSGTHLMESLLERFPMLRHSGKRTLTDPDALSPSTERAIGGIRRGQYRLAHLPAYPALLPMLAREGVRVLFVIRDPRDVLVSYCKYVTEINRTHPSHAHFASLGDDSSRLIDAIYGVERVVEPIDRLLDRYAGWLDAPDVLTVRFEELIGVKGGGQAGTQLGTIRRTSEFLGIELDEVQLQSIAGRVFSERSSTFRKGRIQQWRSVFDASHVAAFKERAGDLLLRYGYESDLTW